MKEMPLLSHSGLLTLRVTLAEHHEPREAWPLELTLGALERLEIFGSHDCKLGDLHLLATAPKQLHLRTVACGDVLLDGDGCVLEDCQLRSLEVAEQGAAAVRKCRLGPGRVGATLRGAVALEQIEVKET